MPVQEASPFVAVGQEGQEYLSHSLFDPQVLMEAQELWDYSYSWDRHTKEATGTAGSRKLLECLYKNHVGLVHTQESKGSTSIGKGTKKTDFK